MVALLVALLFLWSVVVGLNGGPIVILFMVFLCFLLYNHVTMIFQR